MILFPSTIITQHASFVEYRTPSSDGVRVVRVWPLSDPRIEARTEVFHPVLSISPMSLAMSEILLYCQDALSRVQHPASPIVGFAGKGLSLSDVSVETVSTDHPQKGSL